MSIRFRKDRNKWELSFVEDGKRKRRLFDKKTDALGVVCRDAIVDEKSITIEDAARTYFNGVSINKSRTSKKNERRYFLLMIHSLVDIQGLKFLNEVKYGHVLAMQGWLSRPQVIGEEKLDWSPATVNRCFNSVKDFFVHFVRNGDLTSSPCAHLEQLSAEEHARAAMTSEQFALAFEAAPAWFRPAMMFIHLTAAAPSSVERLKWADVNPDEIVITRRKGSKGTWRRIPHPVSPELEALLSGQLRQHEHVFSCEDGSPLSAGWCSRVGNRAIRAAGLKGVVLYSMRHSLASDLTTANVSIEIVRRLMGHSNIRTTQRYAKPETESLASALRLVRGGKCHQNATKDERTSPIGGKEIAT